LKKSNLSDRSFFHIEETLNDLNNLSRKFWIIFLLARFGMGQKAFYFYKFAKLKEIDFIGDNGTKELYSHLNCFENVTKMV